MATYYKYAERNAANQVDWSAIGKSISDTLNNEVKRREKAKQDIEDASNQYAETLANAPMGESRDFNDWTLDFANNAQEFRLMQDRMLKSGRLKLRDYNMARQNLKSGTEQAFNLAKEYNTEYADKMKRMQDGESQDLEGFLMGTAEGFSNFTKSGLYIDPTTGKVAIANKVQKTLPDGTVIYEMSQNPNDFTSINSLRNRITSKYNKFDVSKSLQPGVSDLGKRLEVIMKGGVKTREDAKQTPGYLTARDTFIDSFVETNPDNLTSILTDTLTQVVRNGEATGESFEFTFNPEEAKTSEKFILLKENPQTGRIEGDFTTTNGEKQKEMAKKFLKTKFDTMVDVQETAMPIQTLTAGERTLRAQTERIVDNLSKLWYGNTQEIEAAASFLEGAISSVAGIDVKEKEVTITKIDINGAITGKKGTRYTKSYPRKDFKLFIESISGELGGAVSPSEAVQIATSKLPQGRTAKGGTGSFIVAKPTGLTEKFGSYIENYLTNIEPLSQSEEKAQSQLEGLLKPFGNFEIEQFGAGDYVEIKYPDKDLSLEVNLSEPDAVRQIKNFLVNNIAAYQEGVKVQETNINESLSGAGTGELD
jgi:hypothetical protein